MLHHEGLTIGRESNPHGASPAGLSEPRGNSIRTPKGNGTGHHLGVRSLNSQTGPPASDPQWSVNRPVPMTAAVPCASSNALWTQRTFGRSARVIPFTIPHVDTPSSHAGSSGISSLEVLGCNVL